MEKQIIKDGIKLNVDVSPDLPKIKAHSQEIQQVFLNIISNARYALNKKFPEYHEDKVFEIKGETLTIKGRKHIRMIFYDRGIGISADKLDKVYDPFFSTKPKNEGTGLGLSISHGIIKNHGGDLWFESIEGNTQRLWLIFLSIMGRNTNDSGQYSEGYRKRAGKFKTREIYCEKNSDY